MRELETSAANTAVPDRPYRCRRAAGSTATGLNIPHIGLFFTVSAVTAIVSRVLLCGLDRRLGLPRMIVLHSRPHGAIAAGVVTFPPHYRGLGRTLILAGLSRPERGCREGVGSAFGSLA